MSRFPVVAIKCAWYESDGRSKAERFLLLYFCNLIGTQLVLPFPETVTKTPIVSTSALDQATSSGHSSSFPVLALPFSFLTDCTRILSLWGDRMRRRRCWSFGGCAPAHWLAVETRNAGLVPGNRTHIVGKCSRASGSQETATLEVGLAHSIGYTNKQLNNDHSLVVIQ